MAPCLAVQNGQHETICVVVNFMETRFCRNPSARSAAKYICEVGERGLVSWVPSPTCLPGATRALELGLEQPAAAILVSFCDGSAVIDRSMVSARVGTGRRPRVHPCMYTRFFYIRMAQSLPDPGAHASTTKDGGVLVRG